MSIKNIKVGILGLSYKGDVKDDTLSPAYVIIDKLKRRGIKDVYLFDPFFSKKEIEEKTQIKFLPIKNMMKIVDALVLVTSHKDFKQIYKFLSNSKVRVFIDGRNFLNHKKIKSFGIEYKRVGCTKF